jgi:hypothetical protein
MELLNGVQAACIVRVHRRTGADGGRIAYEVQQWQSLDLPSVP